jgi:hypothetical protein
LGKDKEEQVKSSPSSSSSDSGSNEDDNKESKEHDYDYDYDDEKSDKEGSSWLNLCQMNSLQCRNIFYHDFDNQKFFRQSSYCRFKGSCQYIQNMGV